MFLYWEASVWSIVALNVAIYSGVFVNEIVLLV